MAQQQKPNNPNMQKELGDIKQSLMHRIEMAYVKSGGDIPKERAQCSICKCLVRQPTLECQKCKSYGCAVCVQQKLNSNLIQKSNSCPFNQDCTQSEEYKKVSNPQLDKLLDSLKISCPGTSLKGQEACKEIDTLSYSNCESHFAKCMFILRPCKICGQDIPKKFMPQHLSNECSQSLVNCSDCKQKLMRKELETHQKDQCTAKVLTICRGCHKNFSKMEIEKHEQSCNEIERKCEKCQLSIAKKDEEAHTPSACLILKNISALREEVIKQLNNTTQDKESNSNKKNRPSTGRVPAIRQQSLSPQKQEGQKANEEDETKQDLKTIRNEVEKTSYTQTAICKQMQTLREDLVVEIKRLNSFHSREIESIRQQQQNEQEQLRKNFEVELHFLRDEISQIHNKIDNKTNNSTYLGQENNQFSGNSQQYNMHKSIQSQKQPTINLNDSQLNLYNDFSSPYQHQNKQYNQPLSTKNQATYNNPFGVKYQQFSTTHYNSTQTQDNQSALSSRYPHQDNPLSARRASIKYSKPQKRNDQDMIPSSPESNQKQNTYRGYSQNVRDSKDEGIQLNNKTYKRQQSSDQLNDNLPSINLLAKTPTHQKRKQSLGKNQVSVKYTKS